METKDIQKIIDRAVGTEGILRIPSWWMHKILSDLVQYCDSLESSDAGIKEYLESQLNLVGDAIEALDSRVSEVETHELFAIVSELPSEPKTNTIYLVPSANGDGNNILTEWVYVNGTWEQFGEFKTDVDLSEYVKKADNPFSKGSGIDSAQTTSSFATGDYSVAEGHGRATGYSSHAEGGFSDAVGHYSHAEGESFTLDKAQWSHAEGFRTSTSNEAEHAEGKRNKSNPGTIHSVGIGTSLDDHKNAHEIMQGGEHYIFNVGGYDGTNPTKSKDLATVLNEANTKLTELLAENERLKERIEEQDQFIEDLQNMKIDKENDDYYPKMAVGLADNLAGVDVVDSEINFRRSGGGAISDGVARIESIKGNSVVWNQLCDVSKYGNKTENGVTFTKNADGSISVSTDANGATADTYITTIIRNLSLSHSILIIGCPKGGSTATYSINNPWEGMADVGEGRIYNNTASTAEVRIRVKKGTIISSPIVFRPRYYHLTQMFESGNEPTTIEEFYARIPMGVDLNAYNEGEVIHMDVQSIESVGVNAWDEKATKEILNSDGTTSSSTVRLTTSFIPVIGGLQYFFTAPALHKNAGRQAFYDIDYKLIRYDGDGAAPNSLFTVPNGAAFMRYCFIVDYGQTYNHDICINLSDPSINGKYFPHIKRVEDLSLIRKYFPDGMKSAGTAHDEIRNNTATGKREKVVRIGEVDMGTLNWSSTAGSGYFLFELPKLIKDIQYGDNIMTIYVTYKGEKTPGALPDKSIMLYSGSAYPLLGVKDSAYADAASFKAAMSGVMLYYELAEPIVTELDAEDQYKDLDYQVWNGGTEKANAEGKSAPLAADITYGFNAIGKIKELEEAIKALQTTVASL